MGHFIENDVTDNHFTNRDLTEKNFLTINYRSIFRTF